MFSIIFLIFVAIFLLFTVMKVRVSGLDAKYPKTMECASMKIDKEDLRLVQRDKVNTLKNEGLGYYQCYCEKFAAKK